MSLRVEARVLYTEVGTTLGGTTPTYVDATATGSRAFFVRARKGDEVYESYRTNYARTHILSSGRGLSWLWLKEFEPRLDRRELIFNSRTFAGHPPRVYVPWLHPCGGCASSECGSSVEPGAHTIYGGEENPLLRGGLAMAALAQDYLLTHDGTALADAVKLFEYVEKSEWLDPSGTPTGFFLRAQWPGDIHDETRREYLFASTDELLGVVLGLVHLDRALFAAGDVSNGARVDALADRLGSNLKSNYYFIVPLRNAGRGWEPIGLPEERQKGWSGLFFFQWFVSKGLRAITGGTYEPADDLDTEVEMSEGDFNATSDHPFWKKAARLPFRGPSKEDDRSYLPLAFELSATVRAIELIKVYGFLMYYDAAGTWKPPITCFSLTLEEWERYAEIAENAVTAAYEQVEGEDVTPTLKIDLYDKFPRFNFPLLLHAYQLGKAADASLYADSGGPLVDREMAILLFGVLREGGMKSTINWRNLMPMTSFVHSLARVILEFADVFCDLTLTVEVGTPARDTDYYAASVAHAFGLVADLFDCPIEEPDPSPLDPGVAMAAETCSDIEEWYRSRRLSPQALDLLMDSIGCPRGDSSALPQQSHSEVCRQIENEYESSFAEHVDATIHWARTRFFRPGLPVGERETSGAIVHNPGPDELKMKGQAFCWEHYPNCLTRGGVDGEYWLANEEIEKTARRGADSMLQAAGLDYLLPSVMIADLDEWFGSERIPHQAPYLPACSNVPLLTAGSVFGTKCDFAWPSSPADLFDRTLRNDSYWTSTPLGWPRRQRLSIDTATYPPYTWNAGGVAAGKYTETGTGQAAHINPEQDYDYFEVSNPELHDVFVSVHGSGALELFVDGSPAPAVSTPQVRGITALARATHSLVVTANELSSYELTVDAIPHAVSADVITRVSTPVAILLSATDPEGDPLTFAIVEAPAHGHLTGTDASRTYTPDAGYSGEDHFTFRAHDGFAESNIAVVEVRIRHSNRQ
jgi:hypothetical protein